MSFDLKRATSYIEENFSEFTDLAMDFVSEVDPDSSLVHMDDFDSVVSSSYDAVRMAFYGYNYTGNPNFKEAFNPNCDYFTFNGYGNLVSVAKHLVDKYLLDHIDSISEFTEWLQNNEYYDFEDI